MSVNPWIPNPEDNDASQREIERSRAAAYAAISAEPARNISDLPQVRLNTVYGYARPIQRPLRERQEPLQAAGTNFAAHQHPVKTPPARRWWTPIMEVIDALCGISPTHTGEASGGPGRGLGQEKDDGQQDERNGESGLAR